MIKSTKVAIIGYIIALGFLTAVFITWYNISFHHNNIGVITYTLGLDGLHFPNGSVTPFSSAFGDFRLVYDSAKSLDVYVYSLVNNRPYEGNYFAFAYWLVLPFTLLGPQTATLVYMCIFFILFAALNWNLLIKQTEIKQKTYKTKLLTILQNGILMVAFTFFTYPIFRIFLSGNLDAYVFLLLAGFLLCYMRQKYLLSTLFLSCATAAKFYPCVFVVLYLSQRKFKEALFMAILTLLLTIVPLLCFKSGFFQNLHAHAADMAWFNTYYVQSNRGLSNATSLFAFLRVFAHAWKHFDYNYTIPVTSLYFFLYFALAISLFIISALYVIFVEKVFWKKVFILTCLMILLPYVGFDYRLIQLYLPLYAFVNASADSDTSPMANVLYASLFGLLLTFHQYRSIAGESISVLSYPLSMLLMVAVIVIRSWQIRGFKVYSSFNTRMGCHFKEFNHVK